MCVFVWWVTDEGGVPQRTTEYISPALPNRYREIRHLLNAWSEQHGYDEARCAVNRHTWRYYIACMLAHAVQAQVRWLAEPMAASG